MSNAKSRLRLIEPVRMFDEQRVNIAGNCQRIRGYCLYSSASIGGWGEEGEGREGGSVKSVGGSAAWNKRVAGGGGCRESISPLRAKVARFESNSGYIRDESQATKMRFRPRHRNTRHGFQATNFPKFLCTSRSYARLDFSSSVHLRHGLSLGLR